MSNVDAAGMYVPPAQREPTITPPLTWRVTLTWLMLGALLGFGVLALDSVLGLSVMVASVLVTIVLWRRQPSGRPVGMIAFGVVPAAILSAAAANHTGCAAGRSVKLHAGELGHQQSVACSQVVAGYLSMAVFFTATALGGVAWLVWARNARRDAAASEPER